MYGNPKIFWHCKFFFYILSILKEVFLLCFKSLKRFMTVNLLLNKVIFSKMFRFCSESLILHYVVSGVADIADL
jgi:hypothetical protein